MSRSSVRCLEKHTPLNPAKDRMRRNWIRKTPKGTLIITVSHGALGVLDIMGWAGHILVVDTDPGVIESARYMRETDYTELSMLPPMNCTIQHAVKLLCLVRLQDSNGHKKLKIGAIDLDLAEVMQKCFHVLEEVLNTLIKLKVRTKVMFTFRNGRDNLTSANHRIEWMKARLPKGAKYVAHETYNSLRINSDASRSKGSCMCIVELKVG